jgi:hypothetical protein
MIDSVEGHSGSYKTDQSGAGLRCHTGWSVQPYQQKQNATKIRNGPSHLNQPMSHGVFLFPALIPGLSVMDSDLHHARLIASTALEISESEEGPAIVWNGDRLETREVMWHLSHFL